MQVIDEFKEQLQNSFVKLPKKWHFQALSKWFKWKLLSKQADYSEPEMAKIFTFFHNFDSWQHWIRPLL